MIVATTPGRVRFYSNDGQLFQDGEITIYSPQFLPEDTVLTSTNPEIKIAVNGDEATAVVRDGTSGYVLWRQENLGVAEAFDLVERRVYEFWAQKEQ